MGKLLENISPLRFGFGGAAISGEGGGYGFGKISEDHAIGLLRDAKSRGVKVFDTAPIYGFGMSEQRIGKAFAKERDEVFLVSKSGVTWHENKRVDMTNDPKVTQKMLEQSLRDLNTDYIDLYMIHWPDERVDIRKPMEILARAKDQGKIKHIGLCNTFHDDLEKAFEVEKIEAVQCQMNLFEPEVVERLFPYLNEKEISFMSWGTLDKGILTKRVNEKRKYDKEDCRSWAPWWKQMDNFPKFEKLKRIWPIIEAHGHSPVELALGFNLSHSECSMVLCGARNDEQLDGVLNAMDNLPSKEVLEKVLEIMNEK